MAAVLEIFKRLYLLCFLGISGKSQVLFGLVFLTRYLDLFTSFISVYNSVMKVVFILATLATIYLVFVKFRATYDSNNDTFRAELLVIPIAGLSVLVNHEFTVFEVSKLVHYIILTYDSPVLYVKIVCVFSYYCKKFIFVLFLTLQFHILTPSLSSSLFLYRYCGLFPFISSL